MAFLKWLQELSQECRFERANVHTATDGRYLSIKPVKICREDPLPAEFRTQLASRLKDNGAVIRFDRMKTSVSTTSNWGKRAKTKKTRKQTKARNQFAVNIIKLLT